MSYNIQGIVGDWYKTQTPETQYDFRNWLVTELSTSTLTVTFIKANGDTRVMNCTLQENIIPGEAGISEQVFTESLQEDAEIAAVIDQAKLGDISPVVVWDTDANAWRSFRLDRLQSVA
jgi:hypothetical protein